MILGYTLKRALFNVLLSAGAMMTMAAALLCGIAAAATGIAGVLPAWAAVLISLGTPAAALGVASRRARPIASAVPGYSGLAS